MKLYKPNVRLNDILLLFLKLDELGDRTEAHIVKLIKSFLSGKCHPAMPSMMEVCSDKTLRVPYSPGPLLALDDHLFSVPISTTSTWVPALIVTKQILSSANRRQLSKVRGTRSCKWTGVTVQ